MEEKHHMGGEVNGRILTRSHDDVVLDLLSVRGLLSAFFQMEALIVALLSLAPNA